MKNLTYKLSKILIMFLIFILLQSNLLAFEFNINSKEVVLINLNDQKIIYEQNANQKTYIASLTKIMTAIIALENISDLNTKVSIIKDDVKDLPLDTALSDLKINQEYTYLDLLYGLMLPSGADCANALARLTFKSQEAFITKMNEKAEELGMINTSFNNTHGLDDEKNYSTAIDLSKLFLYAIKNETFYKIISTMKYQNLEHTISFYLNKFNLKMAYLIGGKTGNDTKAGFCLASIAEANNIKYMLITLNAPYSKKTPNHFIDAKNIYEYYISNYNYQTIFQKNSILKEFKTKYLKEESIVIKAQEDYTYYLENDYQDNLNIVYKGTDTITKNNQKSDTLGTLYLYYNNELLDEIPLVLDINPHFSLLKYLCAHKLLLGAILLSIIIIITIVIIILKKHQKKIKYE